MNQNTEDIAELVRISKQQRPKARPTAIGIPKNLSDAIQKLSRVPGLPSLEQFKNNEDQAMSNLHSQIIENWLTANSKFVRYFAKKLKIYDPDTAANILIQGFRSNLLNESFDVEELKKVYERP